MFKTAYIFAKDVAVYGALAHTAYIWITMIPQNETKFDQQYAAREQEHYDPNPLATEMAHWTINP